MPHVECKPWNCSPWVCVSWWCWMSHKGLRCHSEYCWSCPADTGLDPATHGMFWCLLSAWALVQDLYQSGGQNMTISIFFLPINTEGAGVIVHLWKKDCYEWGLSIAPIESTRSKPFAVYTLTDFFKQGTEKEVKVNPTGLCYERLSGVYVGVCHCAHVYGYVGIVKSLY